MAYRQALVTGGAGFIGSHLVEALLEKGCAVKILDNLSTGRLENLAHVRERVNFFQGDIRDTRLLAEAVRGCDVVFHQAAMVSVPKSVENPIESLEINDLGTLRVLEAARKNGVRKVVLASSCAVYGNDSQLPKHESLPLKPMSPYAVHKLIGEVTPGFTPNFTAWKRRVCAISTSMDPGRTHPHHTPASFPFF